MGQLVSSELGIRQRIEFKYEPHDPSSSLVIWGLLFLKWVKMVNRPLLC